MESSYKAYIPQFKSYVEKARHIIDENNYMVIATSGEDSTPWAAPVFYAYDKRYNLYFISAIDSRHAKDIAENPRVAVSIFNSTQNIGLSDGMQIEGRASEVNGAELKKALAVYMLRLYSGMAVPQRREFDVSYYTEPAEFRVFKVSIKKAYLNGVDRRDEVNLNQ